MDTYTLLLRDLSFVTHEHPLHFRDFYAFGAYIYNFSLIFAFFYAISHSKSKVP